MMNIISVADVLLYIYLQRLNSSSRHAWENKIDWYLFAADMESLNELIYRNTTAGSVQKVLSEEKCCLSEIQAFSLFHLSVLK